MKKFLVLGLCIAVLSSCATIFSGSKARITVTDDKVFKPVDLTIDGTSRYSDVVLPAKVKVKRGFKPSTIVAEAEGYETAHVLVNKKFNSTTLFNLIMGGVPGMAIDAATGAITKPESDTYYLNMKPVPYRNDEPEITDNEAQDMVSRDKPGQSELERTVLRWYFDSDPRGARIFWRVISSIPAVVKNTNELYLTTTPYEETRSFNIQGLTYENSRDVQIEIKVTKRGYEDQIKRFNVRQAIDQQEISSFFELVEKEME